MPNVLLTQRCVRSCPYCFARKRMSTSPPDDVLAWEDLVYLVDFYETVGEKRFQILGGEPTLHPDFVDMIIYLLERGLGVSVFTSGVMTDATLADARNCLSQVPPEKLSFVCNLNDPVQNRTPVAEEEAVRRFLAAFGDRTTPGMNLYRTDFELEFLFRLVGEYGMRREIRLGLAHPIPGARNRFIALEDIDRVIERLFSYVPLFERLHLRPSLDCGFPLCRFSDEQLGWLHRFTGGHVRFNCAPVPDIGPDMSVWSCFPLSAHQKRSLYEFDHPQQVLDHFRKLHEAVRVEQSGIYDECDDCVHRHEGRCQGGCLAHAVEHFRHEAPLRMKEVYA